MTIVRNDEVTRIGDVCPNKDSVKRFCTNISLITKCCLKEMGDKQKAIERKVTKKKCVDILKKEFRGIFLYMVHMQVQFSSNIFRLHSTHSLK